MICSSWRRYARGVSRSCRMAHPYSEDKMVESAFSLVSRSHADAGVALRVAALTLTASGMEKFAAAGSSRIDDMLRAQPQMQPAAGAECASSAVRSAGHAASKPTPCDAPSGRIGSMFDRQAKQPQPAPCTEAEAGAEAAAEAAGAAEAVAAVAAAMAAAEAVDAAEAAEAAELLRPSAAHRGSPARYAASPSSSPNPRYAGRGERSARASPPSTQLAPAGPRAAEAERSPMKVREEESGRGDSARPAKYARLCEGELDPDVLAELPEEVRLELLAELRASAGGRQAGPSGAARDGARGREGGQPHAGIGSYFKRA
ncbi:hypothetical protein T492DRAFT_202791 [Pavlovales sp. CCMP2436]|nr:hypothetical protein T492DRAFT_202791 [Pavlovales sp. CCMP2436]